MIIIVINPTEMITPTYKNLMIGSGASHDRRPRNGAENEAQPSQKTLKIETLIQDLTTLDADSSSHSQRGSGPLTLKATAILQQFFAKVGHRPSREMWHALTAVLETLEAMADRKAEPLIYLSSLDPGVGKSTATRAFLKALLVSPNHRDVSALVCVARLDEIEKLVTESGLPEDSFAVFTAKGNLTADKTRKLNDLGCGDPGNARILISTHAMLERKLKGRSFAEVQAFHYQGKPRDVRCYDEAILPGRTLTVTRDHISRLLVPMRRLKPSLRDALESLNDTLRDAEDRAQFIVPDLASEHDVNVYDALAAVKSDEDKSIVEVLWSLFGRVASIRRDGPNQNTLLEYVETIPDDFLPLVVLDASARIRATYRLWEDSRGNIKRLPEAPKDYSPLTVHMWPVGGGKRSFRKRGELLIEGVANTINNTIPADEDVLVIYHLNVGHDVKREIELLLRPRASKVHFLSLGRHDITNGFKDVPNVILAGTLFYPLSHYEALTRLAADYPSAMGRVPEEYFKEVVRGESRHVVLQAVCRSKVRQSNEASCYPTNAFIIAAPKSGIRDDLQKIFPGCQVADWQPVTTPLRGKVGKALAYMHKRFAEGAKSVPFAELMRHLAIANKANFNKNIRRHKALQNALDKAGIIEWPEQRPNGFMKASNAYFPETIEELNIDNQNSRQRAAHRRAA